MSKMSDQSMPQRHPNAIFRSVDGEGVVVLPGVGEVKVLNPAGALIWQHLDGKKTVQEIAQAVTEEFEVEPDSARADVLAFVQELEEREMLQPAGS